MLVVFLAVTSLSGLKHLREVTPAYNSITISGEGEAFAIPDIATFSFNVSADASTVATAQETVTKKMDAVLKALQDLNIEEKDIKTSDYSVYPKYVYGSMPCSLNYCPPSEQRQDGYTASHSVTVKVRKTDDAGKALAAAGENGATNLSSLSFAVDNPDQISQEARKLAIKDAMEKAKVLSRELGVKLVRVVSFSDSSSDSPVPYYTEASAGGLQSRDAKAPTLPVGENKVRIQVSVTYEIR